MFKIIKEGTEEVDDKQDNLTYIKNKQSLRLCVCIIILSYHIFHMYFT